MHKRNKNGQEVNGMMWSTVIFLSFNFKNLFRNNYHM